MMPDVDGLQVLHRLRASGDDVPVLFLTARDAVEDRVAGLTAGGDDYVTKPFSLEEVVARLRALMRRAGAVAARDDARLVVGDLVLDEDSHEVSRAGVEVGLTATEFKYSRATGLLYLITFAASIPAAFYFLTPILDDPNYVLGAGEDTRVIIGALLDTVNALASIGTAVALSTPSVAVPRHRKDSLVPRSSAQPCRPTTIPVRHAERNVSGTPGGAGCS